MRLRGLSLILALLVAVGGLTSLGIQAVEGYPNGQIPSSQLSAIPGGATASKPAAAAFNTARFCSVKDGVDLYVGGANSGYRARGVPADYPPPLYGTQWYFWGAYQAGKGNLAAPPGTSNHGYGNAFDLGLQRMRTWLDRYGGPFGIRKVEAFSEWWHMNYTGGFSGPNPGMSLTTPSLSKGAGGSSSGGRCLRPYVVDLQRRLRVSTTGYFGAETAKAVRKVQQRARLKKDGVVGPATWNAIRKQTSDNQTSVSIRAIQSYLNARFKEWGRKSWLVTVDGKYGGGTRKAVRRFQQVRKLPITGRVDARTLKSLKRPAKKSKPTFAIVPTPEVKIPACPTCTATRTKPIRFGVLHTTESSDILGTTDITNVLGGLNARGLSIDVINDREGYDGTMTRPGGWVGRRTFHASTSNNESVGIEQIGYARFTAADWKKREKQLDNTASWLAYFNRELRIPIQRCTVTKGVVTKSGWCAHGDVDPVNRTDPGAAYPWDYVLTRARALAGAKG